MTPQLPGRLTAPLPVLALAISAAARPLVAQEPDQVEIEIVPVAGTVSMLRAGNFGNIGVSVGPDGILIVDDQIAPLAPKIRVALDSLGEGDLAFVLNTHWHGDHTHGNTAFGDEAPILAHHNVRKRLSTTQEILGQVFEPLPDDALPVVTFADSISIWFNGEEIRAIHLPMGHTDGDVIVWFTESNVVHMGDLLLKDVFPFVDLASGGDVEGYAANVATALAKIPPDAQVIPGHGELATVDDLRRTHTMLLDTIGIVRERMAEGKSLAEIQSEGFPETWASWSWPFVTTASWIETIWRSLSGHEEGSRP